MVAERKEELCLPTEVKVELKGRVTLEINLEKSRKQTHERAMSKVFKTEGRTYSKVD